MASTGSAESGLRPWWTPSGWVKRPAPEEELTGSSMVVLDENVGKPDGQSGVPIYPLVRVAGFWSGDCVVIGEASPRGTWGRLRDGAKSYA